MQCSYYLFRESMSYSDLYWWIAKRINAKNQIKIKVVCWAISINQSWQNIISNCIMNFIIICSTEWWISWFISLKLCNPVTWLSSDLTSSSSSGGQGPRFIYEPPSFQGFSNNTGGSLSCSAHGVPQPKISWLEGNSDQVTSHLIQTKLKFYYDSIMSS